MICRPLDFCDSAMPRIAKLSASVPPLKKTISETSALINRATCCRASSIRVLASCPNQCMEDALPNWSVNTGIIAAATCGRIGVVALLSRYTRRILMIITLTTDFGLSDPFVGIMKGVILGIAPDVQIVDITHAIPAYEVAEAASIVDSFYR